jgi:transcriptional regulator GlxA family with amidase domain
MADRRAVARTEADEAGVLSPEVREAVRYMTTNYAGAVTLDDLARLTNRSSFQMIRAFRRELGITPHSWLIQLRLRVGASLLERGESIASIACDVGFADQAHFTRHFKRLHGETPNRFRKAASAYAGTAGTSFASAGHAP